MGGSQWKGKCGINAVEIDFFLFVSTESRTALGMAGVGNTSRAGLRGLGFVGPTPIRAGFLYFSVLALWLLICQ